ncbi:AraC family transcriptional regulator [Pelosinus sp. IPA-1]|uniref:AraC family transcriptional regulator n=1 Tax=Pelosinus sp. IPA-1 TaxID=3029569 RepID=UPI0024361847|nr:AraC family transcriptional regulator [Pelosinus sp. IPA-1]GMB01091.1 putative HTH-type transcriptional regulator YdeC [Pelosinus sp. IPA-1]
MGFKVLNIGKNKLENRDPVKDDNFPFQIVYDEITDYIGSSFGCHWHPELELTYIVSGSMTYQSNNSQYVVTEGDAIFVNQNCLHNAAAISNSSCSYFALIFYPMLLSGHKGSVFENKYLAELVTSERLPFAYFNAAGNNNKHIISLVIEIEKIHKEKSVGYELLIMSKLFELCFYLYQDIYCKLPNGPHKQHKNIVQIKSALDYIHTHYKENLTLDVISSSCNLSKSSCCRLFKKIVHQTPFDYLLNYRIQKSIPYLLSDEMNITEVALAVGFFSSSYYSETFKKYMKCSPTSYKRMIIK